MVDLYSLKITAEKAELIQSALDAIDEATIALENVINIVPTDPVFIANLNVVADNKIDIVTVASVSDEVSAVGSDVIKGKGENTATDSAILNALDNANIAISKASEASTSQSNAKISEAAASVSEANALVSENNAKASELAAADSAASVDAGSLVHTEGSGLANELLTYLKTIDGSGSGLDADLLDGHDSTSYFKNDGTSTGDFSTTSHIEAGRGSGGVALSINDGCGNANLTFNHKSGVPDNNGSSYRVETSVDGTDAIMSIEMKGNTTSGTAVALTQVMELRETSVTLQKDTTLNGSLSVTGTVDGRDVSADGVKLDGHIANVSNPHSVTKTQVGLGNVDDTSDMDKPVSTAQDARFTAVEATANAAAPQVTTYTKDEVNGAVGNIMSPLLDLPLKNSLVMKAGVGAVTFTRSTTGTYIDRYGVLQTADIDEPRFEEYGLLVEGTSTNMVLNSGVVDDVTNCTVTNNDIASPNTTLTADKVTGDGTEGEHFCQKLVSVDDDTETYTISVFVKKGTSDTATFMAIFDGGTSISTQGTFTFSTETATNGIKVRKLVDGWYRLSLSFSNNNSGNTTLYNRVYIGEKDPTSTTTDYIYVWGMQTEHQPFATSYMPTDDAAITRAADSILPPAINNVTANTSEVSYFIKFRPLGVNPDDDMCLFEKGKSLYNLVRVARNTDRVTVYCNGASVVTPPIAYNKVNSICVTYQVSNTNNVIYSVYFNGVHVNTSTQNYYNINADFNSLNIGKRHMGSNFYYGHLPDFILYDKVLTPTEIALLG